MLKYYHPGMDASNELEDPDMYQQLIVILRWACELGWIDTLTEVSALYQYLCNPIDVNIDGVLNIFNYLNVRRKCTPVKL